MTASPSVDTRPTVLVLGAHSDIGRATARAFAGRGHALILAARQVDRLAADAEDLRIRHGVTAGLREWDALADDPNALLDGLPDLPDIVVCVIGLLGDQTAARHDEGLAERIMQTNYLAPARILAAVADRFEARGHGTIVGISSVAGDRGRATNYVYGSAKAGFTAFLSGLRNRLSRAGVPVITVKPGFVRTRMTEGMKLPPPLTADPDEVAVAIVRACAAGRDVVYVRPVWRLIMTAIVLLPERVFKRLSL